MKDKKGKDKSKNERRNKWLENFFHRNHKVRGKGIKKWKARITTANVRVWSRIGRHAILGNLYYINCHN